MSKLDRSTDLDDIRSHLVYLDACDKKTLAEDIQKLLNKVEELERQWEERHQTFDDLSSDHLQASLRMRTQLNAARELMMRLDTEWAGVADEDAPQFVSEAREFLKLLEGK